MKCMKKLVAFVTMISVLSMSLTAFAAEPTGIGFEQVGLTCKMKLGETAYYWTADYYQEDYVRSNITILSDEIVAPNETLQAKEGYEWRKVTSQIVSKEAWILGIRPSYCYEDYYDIVFHDNTSVYNEATGRNTYSVIKDGVVYSECERFDIVYEWIDDQENMTTSQIREYYFCIPVGYDGTVIGFMDSYLTWEEGQYIYDVDDGSTIFYRLQ